MKALHLFNWHCRK